MRRRALASLVLAALVGVPMGWARADEPSVDVGPVSDQAYTLDLEAEGLVNGRLPSIRLIEVHGCLLERDAAYTMSLMLEAASADGVELQPAWCYRTVSDQQQTLDRNCPTVIYQLPQTDASGVPVVHADGTTPTVSVAVRTCSVPTAQVGTSNHGWGRAVDFARGRREMGCRDPGFAWLQEHAADYGWVHPGWAACGTPTAEPWHWEYGGLRFLLPVTPEVPVRSLPPNVT